MIKQDINMENILLLLEIVRNGNENGGDGYEQYKSVTTQG
jgi:hypothetical protein